MTVELRYYRTSAFDQPVVEWLRGLNDRQARTRTEARLARAAVGNFGDVEPVGEGVMELGKRAKAYFEDYKARSAKKPRGA